MIALFFLPSLSNRNPKKGVPTIAPMDGRLPSSDISVSVIGLFRTVLGDMKSMMVVDGRPHIRPKFRVLKCTGI